MHPDMIVFSMDRIVPPPSQVHSGLRLRTLAPLYPEAVFELVPALSSDFFVIGRNDVHDEELNTMHTHGSSRSSSPVDNLEERQHVHINSRVVSKRHARIQFEGEQVQSFVSHRPSR